MAPPGRRGALQERAAFVVALPVASPTSAPPPFRVQISAVPRHERRAD